MRASHPTPFQPAKASLVSYNRLMDAYRPLQIPQLLSEQFRALVAYEEHVVPELDHLALCVWTMRSSALRESVTNRILPDGCIDLVVDFSNGSICFSGQSRASEDFELSGAVDYLGVRLHPGMFHQLYDVPATTVLDTMLPLSALPGADRLDNLLAMHSTEQRIARVASFFQTRTHEHDPSAAARPLESVLPRIYEAELNSVTAVAEAIGYSPRQTSRLFHEHLGVSPKTFLNIVRLHEGLRLLEAGERDLTGLAHRAGFSDQAHFTREIKRYTGLSPVALHRELQQRRRETMAVSCKTL